MDKTSRLEWMDVSKGIGAFLVILGHFAINNKFAALIYCFHMPLFFFLSGTVFKIEKYATFKQFAVSKFKSLLIPYLIFNVFIWIFNVIKILVCGQDTMLIAKRFIGIFLGIKMTDYYGECWFISCMFVVQILAYFVVKFTSAKKNLICGSAIASLAIGWLYLSKIGIPLPWGIETSFIALFFFLLGYCLGTDNLLYSKMSIVLFIPMIIGALVNYKLSGYRVEMFANQYGVFLIYVLVALCGIFATIAASKIVTNVKFLQMLGKNSLYLYGAQLIFTVTFQEIANEYNLWWLSIKITLPITIVLTITCLTLLLLIKKYYERLYEKCLLIFNKYA